MPRVWFSSLALSDIEEIRDYLLERNATAAEKLLDEIDARCDLLGKQPGIGRICNDLLADLRVVPVTKNYALFYRIAEDAVEIVRVVHAARDFNRVFGGPPN